MNPTITNIPNLVNECASIFKLKAQDKHIELLVDYSQVNLFTDVIIDGSRVK